MFPKAGTNPELPMGLWGLSPAQGYPLAPRLVSLEVPRSPSQTPEQGGWGQPSKAASPCCLCSVSFHVVFLGSLKSKRTPGKVCHLPTWSHTLVRRRGERAGGALNAWLALPAVSSAATQVNCFFSLPETSSVAKTVAAQRGAQDVPEGCGADPGPGGYHR